MDIEVDLAVWYACWDLLAPLDDPVLDHAVIAIGAGTLLDRWKGDRLAALSAPTNIHVRLEAEWRVVPRLNEWAEGRASPTLPTTAPENPESAAREIVQRWLRQPFSIALRKELRKAPWLDRPSRISEWSSRELRQPTAERLAGSTELRTARPRQRHRR